MSVYQELLERRNTIPTASFTTRQCHALVYVYVCLYVCMLYMYDYILSCSQKLLWARQGRSAFTQYVMYAARCLLPFRVVDLDSRITGRKATCRRSIYIYALYDESLGCQAGDM